MKSRKALFFILKGGERMTIESDVIVKIRAVNCMFKKDGCVANCNDCPLVTGDVFVVGRYEPKASDLSPPIPKRLPKEEKLIQVKT